MEILLTRHGKTEWNALKKVQGKADIALNEEGIKQANDTRILLKNENIDLILCSPLTRAMQTAKIINRERNIPMVFDERLSERILVNLKECLIQNLIMKHFGVINKTYNITKQKTLGNFFKEYMDFLMIYT